jgi:sec-independent protein translocase protein TatA
MLGNIGPLEIGIVAIIALVIFGPKRLPELGSGLGRGMREFKENITGEAKDEPQAEQELEPKAVESTVTTVKAPEKARESVL